MKSNPVFPFSVLPTWVSLASSLTSGCPAPSATNTGCLPSCPLYSSMASFFLVTSLLSYVNLLPDICLFSPYPHFPHLSHPQPQSLSFPFPLPLLLIPSTRSPSLSAHTHSPTHRPPSQLGSCAYVFLWAHQLSSSSPNPASAPCHPGHWLGEKPWLSSPHPFPDL